MNTSVPLLYTNEVPADFLSQLDTSSFTVQQLSTFNEQALKFVKQRHAYHKTHPPIAIYRVATEGSQTRNGGVIKKPHRSLSSSWLTAHKYEVHIKVIT